MSFAPSANRVVLPAPTKAVIGPRNRGEIVVKARYVVLLLCITASAAWVAAQETLPGGAAVQGTPATQPPPTDARHYSYALGLDLGTSFRNDKMQLDVESVMAGVRDGLEGKDPKYSLELCQLAMQRLAEERMQVMLQRNKQFLAENAKAQGVQVTPSGLQYKVLKAGDGPTPTAEDTVRVHYRGQLIDGTVFDESYGGEPAVLDITGPPGVIPGWKEALEMMKVGAKWQLAVPSNLAYGEQGRGPIPPGATLVFEVELLGIEGKQ
jgi:FKBP-type peptidyl-prolyl cis-trans isomerase FklB